MASNDIQTNDMETNSNNEEQQEPVIKQEPFEKWELPREVDLISDDGSQDDAAISNNEPPSKVPTAARNGVNPARVSEKKRPSRADLLAMQQKLADKYRKEHPKSINRPLQQQQPEPELEPEPEPEPESESDDEEAKYEQAKKSYLKKKKANKLSVEEEIAFMKIESDEMARKRKAEADAAYDLSPSDSEEDNDNESDLFVARDRPDFSEIDSDDELPPAKSRKRKNDSNAERPAKKRARGKKALGTGFTDDDVTKILDQARSQEKAKSRAKKPTTKGKSRKEPHAQMTNLQSLFGNDVFADTAATTGLGPQPTFADTTRRNDALKQLAATHCGEDTNITKADRNFLEKALRDFTGVGSVQAKPDGKWQVKGMKTGLHHFQVLAAGWLRKRENDNTEPRGGILADEMGLGKTLTMLANIINGRPLSKGRNGKTTLIVCSPALVSQWYQEIRAHCQTRNENKKHGLGTVLVYRAGTRIHSNDDMSIFENADIVLTTWSEVLRSYPKPEFPDTVTTAKAKIEFWDQLWENYRGPLHRMKWLRVVLDEAQAIKNHLSRTSQACIALRAKHYWAISGTPVMNTIKEFYPYFCFIREPYSCASYKIFVKNFVSPNDPDGSERLSVMLKRIMIRRSHIDTFMGARLVNLPDPKEFTLYLSFNAVETSIYHIIRQRFIQRINSMSRHNELEKQYSNIWTMCLRLRQICGHILLIQETFMDLCQREDYEKLNALAQSEENENEDGAEILYHLRQVLRNSEGMKTVDSGLGGGTITETEALATGVQDIGDTEGQTGGKHGITFHFAKYLANLRKSERWDDLVKRSICCVCHQTPQDPQVTSCFHVYCATCLADLQHYAAKRGRDQARCADCGEEYTSSKPCEEALIDISKRQSSFTSTGSKTKKKRSQKSKKDEQEEDWLNMKGEVLYSTKTQAFKSQVLEWIAEDPDVKIIVYSQWLSMLRILGRICVTEGWEFCKYSGDMSHESRGNSIEEFRDNKYKRILLASLKAGSLGLNLTMAWKVICLDSWWNQGTEQQAFCRVFRISQTRETAMTRIVISNTIDQAMMELKERKKLEIDEVMNSSRMRDKLAVEDLMNLFGRVGSDGEGNPFIFAEETSDDHPRYAERDKNDEADFMGNDE